MNKSLAKIINIAVPVVVIALMTLCCCYLYLFDGICSGDDFRFHMGNIYDVYFGLKNGLGIDSTNHILMGAYAYNTHLFYAPLPHYGAGILMYIFNATTINAFKWFVGLMTFFAGLMFYCLAFKISKRMTVALFSAAFFIFCPYRMFCGYARFAYAETIAMCFMPCFFYGIYSITHDKDPQAFSFLAIVVGACGLILSHPFTAVSCALIAILYLIVHFKGVWNFIKTKKGIIFAALSIALIILGVGFYAFPMIKALGSEQYLMSNDSVVWTNYQHIFDSTKNSSSFSGILNLVWIKSRIGMNDWPAEWTPLNLCLGVVMLFIGTLLAAAADLLLMQFPKNKYYRLPLMIVVSFLPLVVFRQRTEVYLAMALFDLMMIIMEFIKDKGDALFTKKDWFKRNKHAFIDVIFFAVISIITMIFIYVGEVWAYVPSFFYTCQFSWRLWSIIALTTSILFAYGLNALCYLKLRTPLLIAGIVPFLLFASSQAYPEKTYVIDSEKAWISFEEKDVMQTNNVGVMNEYMPIIYYGNDYTPSYPNSLYKKVKSTIGNWRLYQHTLENYIDPVFLEGSGSIEITALNTPSVDFNITVTEDAFIQIPQFFYEGYEIKAISNETETKLEPISTDSLVSFRLEKGTYEVEVRYVGPKTRRVFNKLWYISLVGDAALGAFGIYELIKKRKIDAEIN